MEPGDCKISRRCCSCACKLLRISVGSSMVSGTNGGAGAFGPVGTGLSPGVSGEATTDDELKIDNRCVEFADCCLGDFATKSSAL